MKYKRILFVCSANTCRSPMAQAIFEDMVEKDPELQSSAIYAKSAGTFNSGRHRASDEVIQVMHEKGLEIRQHSSRQIDGELIDWADVILAMQLNHREYILSHFPRAEEKAHLHTEFVGQDGEVPDPSGCAIEMYRECADRLMALLEAVLEKAKS